MDTQIQELKNLMDELAIIISARHGEELLQKAMKKREEAIDHYLRVEKDASQLVRELLQMEESVAQKVLDLEEEKQNGFLELRKIEEELKQSQQQNLEQVTELKYPFHEREELEELEKIEEDTAKMEEEVDEDTLVVIPSTKYLAHIFHKVTNIIWDYDSDPSVVKGIHFGKDITQPINIDATKHSESFICDYLWNLVSTDW
uniref:Kinetochore protein Spc24 n=1 Tax=Callorhinchus milii TaxID=7868 RepID=A0A4W3GZE6_CALMI